MQRVILNFLRVKGGASVQKSRIRTMTGLLVSAFQRQGNNCASQAHHLTRLM
jgi:hypothetical protein